ncbi:hypothetical protein [Hymenobacter arizonensis]|uniref:Uncharacterized protein n=1 Tax=Hymenobacter arizonensis TaxID=1227077 RepID=A0A1I6BF20_HYMAR|nr:hypothetical protein [Hymenobacter arizonensis]SFQ79552.1 hypothetical protein SAMN04515668_4456 [Hymenobacter arizonensis]
MAQSDRIDEGLQEAIALGERNKALLPRLRNWCSHLIIEDQLSGMVAQFYGLPINLALYCPHATGEFMSANLEMNARHFIEEQCIGCHFHTELMPRNFGRDVLAQHKQRQRQAEHAAHEHAARRAELQAEIEVLVRQEQLQGHITALSVINLVQQLQAADGRASTAATIREAADLVPQFFSAAALNYLTLYLEGPVGPVLLATIRQVLLSGAELPAFALDQVVAIIQRGHQLDAAVGVFTAAVAPTDLPMHGPLLASILAHLEYDYRLMRAEEGEELAYPHVVELVRRFAQTDASACQELLTEQVRLPEKRSRIRIMGLLRELITTAPDIVLPLTDVIVRALDFAEDGYGESADHATRHTLALLYRHAPEQVLAVLRQTAPTLSTPGQVEILEFYGRALQDSDLLLPAHAALLAEELVTDLAAGSGPTQVQEERLHLVVKAACRAPAHFIPHVTVLLGVLLTVVKELRTLRRYQAELEYPSVPAPTFNPLLGKHPLEIQNLDVHQQRRVSEVERMMSQLLNADSIASQPTVLEVFAGLNSETDGFIKSRLIKVLRDSLPDPIRISAILPVLYASLFDTARDVRWEALRFLEYLLDEQPACVTRSLLDAVKALLQDSDLPIRGQAIQTYGALMRQYPQEVAPDQLKEVIAAIHSPTVALHKAAVATAHALIPFLTESQRQILLMGIQALEGAYYENQDFTYSQELVRTLLWLVRDTKPLFLELAERYLTKYCACEEFYTAEDALKRLTRLLPENPELRPAWLPQALQYLIRVEPSYSPTDLRGELLVALHQLSYAELVAQQYELARFVRTQIAAGHFYDAFSVYAVFGAQGLHAQVYELTQHLAQGYPPLKQRRVCGA